MGMTLYEKVFNKHIVSTLPSGQVQLLIGLHMIHEVTSPQAFAMLRERNLKVAHPERTFATVDHVIPTDDITRPFKDERAEEMMAELEKNTLESGITFFNPGSGNQGIVHMVAPEQGLTQPGITLCCGDSHTATHGAFGCIAFGIGSSQVRDVLATQSLIMEKLKVRKIEINGKLAKGVTAKDVILYIIAKLGVNGGVGYAYEFAGEVFEAFSMDERMTVCNMAIEGGARVGYINPDQTTYDYLNGRPYAPKGEAWEKAVAYWNSIRSDADAVYDDVVEFRAEDIAPMVTWGITPGHGIGIDEVIPSVDCFGEAEQSVVREAYEYMGVNAGESMQDRVVDVVFIGSCTNGRFVDFEQIIDYVKGKKVADGVRAMIVPGSELVEKQLKERGWDKIFTEAGFEFRKPGCSMCLAMNADRLIGRQLCASSSNRNFKGRQGSPTGRTVLMSPLMCAVAAVHGKIQDCRKELA